MLCIFYMYLYYTILYYTTYYILSILYYIYTAARRTLKVDHPVNRFLQPFLFNTCAINQGMC